MTSARTENLKSVRSELAAFELAAKVSPNAQIAIDRVFTPESHRSVLDLGRQLVVGNRGMGKSFWTHALVETGVRERVAAIYRQPQLAKTTVVIGFNASDKPVQVAPTRKAIGQALEGGTDAADIWRAVIYRAARAATGDQDSTRVDQTIALLKKKPYLFEETLATIDDDFARARKYILIVFDALDRLADDWSSIRELTGGLLKQTLGLKSFQSLRAKIFIRPDQYADPTIFQFPDGSKLKNEHVDLSWQPHELFGLVFFEICRDPKGRAALEWIAKQSGAAEALSEAGLRTLSAQSEQIRLVNEIAGQYMGTDARRGRVYTWVPLHLSDARNACSPRTFLTAWKKAAEHEPRPKDLAVDHLGLIEGVRRASSARLEELKEDYGWIGGALETLRGEFVPLDREALFEIWQKSDVVQRILKDAAKRKWLAPVQLLTGGPRPAALLDAMKNIAVMEERANGKINVPDIFRVEAGIKRKGGVAVPRKT
jgi:hypothetical protein